MHNFEYTETFTRNPRDGEKFHIADAKIEVECVIKWDGKELPEAAAQYLIAYGIRQATADKWSAGGTREQCIEVYNDRVESYMDGTFAERGSGGTSVVKDPVTQLAHKTARTDILAAFKAATGKTKIAHIFDASEKAALYFDESEPGKFVWKAEMVQIFIDNMEATGKRDYMAEADKTINGAEDLLGDL